MPKLEYGIVKMFTTRGNTYYGFLYVLDVNGQRTGEELFFHFTRGRWFRVIGGESVFVGSNSSATKPSSLPFPLAGDKLVFRRGKGKGGRPCTAQWGYVPNTKPASPPRRYRVVKTTTMGFIGPKIITTVIWEGSDLDKLSREYPPSDIHGADALTHIEIEDGLIRFDYEFWELVGDVWQPCADKRRRIMPVTDYERRTDAENRRDFPGDYI